MTDSSPPPAAPTPPPPTPALPTGGEVGKPRSAGLTILLTIVTLGFWTLLWSFWTGDDLKKARPDGLGGVAYLFITLLVAPVTMFLMASEVEKLYTEDGREAPITTLWGLWFLLPIIGMFIWYLRIQRSLNDFWVSKGADGSSPGI
jgi:hypothetical protein